MFAPELPSIQVAIRVIGDYGNAREYPDPDPSFAYDGEFGDDARSKVRRYIESHDNCEFEVVVSAEYHPSLERYLDGNNGLQFTVFVDGEHMGRRFLRPSNLSDRQGGFWKSVFVGKKGPGPTSDSHYLRRFVFAPMRTVEDSTTDAEIRRAQALGTIEIVLRTAKFNGFKEGFGDKRGNRHWEVADPADIPGYPYSEISEKALKGRSITHSIAYSPPEQIGAGNRDGRVRRLDSKVTDRGQPLVSFLYKYRSIEGMKREGAIPRTPPPDYKEAVPKAEELSQHELGRLARQRLRQMKRVRDESRLNSQPSPDDSTSLGKRRHDAHDLTGEERQSKMARVDPRDIIDLTQDDQEHVYGDAQYTDEEEVRYDGDHDVVIVE